MLFTSTIMLLAQRQTGGKRGRSDICISILPQWKLRHEKFSDTLWSQQDRGKKSGHPYSSQVPRLHMFVLCRGLQFGYCKRATNKHHPIEFLKTLRICGYTYSWDARATVCFITEYAKCYFSVLFLYLNVYWAFTMGRDASLSSLLPAGPTWSILQDWVG